MMSIPEAPAFAALRDLGVPGARLDYAFTEGGGTAEAARKLGIDEHLVVKSLVVDDGAGGHAVRALMHGDRRVSMRGRAASLPSSRRRPCAASASWREIS